MRATVRWLALCATAVVAMAAVSTGCESRQSNPDVIGPPEARRVARSTQTPSERRCMNDYTCRYGEHCIKPINSLDGFCATVVNEFGSPTQSPPRPGSLLPGGATECRFLSDCPVGFRCNVQGPSGHCVR
jgi:hypothetical protein